MELTERDKGNHKIIELSGNLDIYSASKIKKEINKKIDDEEIESLILDMSKVTHMDSSGIAMLANLQKRMKSDDLSFALLSVTNDIMAVLRLSSLDSFFKIYQTETEVS
ncbi:MAG: STAS domain-containing protein [Leptospiraceae bacterium]|nr:STAS domain-containing protein [Leptospiraceae bacterium]MCP5498679.1 STAS domain-containing protein [Leptospiraceae bacterium]